MNVLRRNWIFCVRKPNKIKASQCSVNTRSFVNHALTKSQDEFTLRIAPSVKSIQRSSLSLQKVHFSSEVSALSQLDYEHFCAETLDDLCAYIEELIENSSDLATADVVNKVTFETVHPKCV